MGLGRTVRFFSQMHVPLEDLGDLADMGFWGPTYGRLALVLPPAGQVCSDGPKGSFWVVLALLSHLSHYGQCMAQIPTAGKGKWACTARYDPF